MNVRQWNLRGKRLGGSAVFLARKGNILVSTIFSGEKRGKPAHEKRLCKFAETTPKNRDKKAAKQPKKMKFQLDERKYNISNMLKTMRKQIKTCAKLLKKQESIKKLL